MDNTGNQPKVHTLVVIPTLMNAAELALAEVEAHLRGQEEHRKRCPCEFSAQSIRALEEVKFAIVEMRSRIVRSAERTHREVAALHGDKSQGN